MTLYIDVDEEKVISADIGSTDVKITYLIGDIADNIGEEQILPCEEFLEMINNSAFVKANRD
jgi:hypothetical protein